MPPPSPVHPVPAGLRTEPTRCRPAPRNAAIAENGGDTSDRNRNAGEDPATELRCAGSKALRSTLGEHRPTVRHARPAFA
jgi:hypothetical protein